MSTTTRMIHCRVPVEMDERLSRLSSETARSKSYYIIQAIAGSLTKLEMIYTSQRRAEEYRAGKVQSVPLEEAIRRYGLDD